MAYTCPSGFDVGLLRNYVQETYGNVAARPGDAYHFHRGAEYARVLLGYDPVALAGVPRESTDRFAGVGNPHAIGDVRPGEQVLDIGCGAGMDLIIAARRVAPTGKAIGVDMTAGMRDQAQRSARQAGLEKVVEVRAGFAEELPVDDESIDVVQSNGVINLSPNKEKVFREIARVLKPGGRLHLADVVVQRELTLQARSNEVLWAACIGGALPEPELFELAELVGLRNARITARFDSFKGTSAEGKVSKDLQVQGANFFATK